jgi:hypothetical protein
LAIIWKNIAFYGILLAVLFIIVCYFFDWLGFKPAINALIAKLPPVNTTALTKLITDNWMSLLPLGVTAIGLVGTYVKYHFEVNKNKLLLEQQKELIGENLNLLTEKESASSKASSLQQQLSTYEGDTTSETLQKRLGELTGTKEQLEIKIQHLISDNETLAKEPTRLIQSLWQNSGGKVIDVAGEKVKVIELVKETVR